MRGDFSRVTFDPLYNFSRVLMQQGRVQLDADFNEQTAILLHFLRRLTADVVGPYGIPVGQGKAAFELTTAVEGVNNVVRVAGGRAYVGGLLVELPVVDEPEQMLTYAGELKDGQYVIYLEAWERHVTWHETAALIREVALGDGVDTATRAQVVWRLGAMDIRVLDEDQTCEGFHKKFSDPSLPEKRGMMRARTDDARADEACVVPADARYRGLENQLYRVEIHSGGGAGDATFKWSRDNGAVVFPVDGAVGAGNTEVRLLHLGRDDRFGLEENDWVEVVGENDAAADPAAPRPLLKVKEVNRLERTVKLSGGVGADLTAEQRPILRRWDHRGPTLDEATGALRLYRETAGVFDWLNLEDGLQVQFTPEGEYQAGDYWLIPARTATGGIEWPMEVINGKPAGVARPARREERYRMPLGIVKFPPNGAPEDCRRFFKTLTG